MSCKKVAYTVESCTPGFLTAALCEGVGGVRGLHLTMLVQEPHMSTCLAELSGVTRSLDMMCISTRQNNKNKTCIARRHARWTMGYPDLTVSQRLLSGADATVSMHAERGGRHRPRIEMDAVRRKTMSGRVRR